MSEPGDGAGRTAPGPGGGTLFVVSTPIGNLGDITPRALETLRACDRILAEDTRRARQLLTHFGIAGKPVQRLDAHTERGEAGALVADLTRGARLALVTDAGTPAISDPGDKLVVEAIRAGVRVVPIPGPSAALAALVASGLAGGGGFRFLGFLPREGPPRREAITLACETAEPVILFESPNRLRSTLRDLAAATPDRPACVARELTKVHEEFVRGSLRELAELGEGKEGRCRAWMGELCVVLGAHDPAARVAEVDDATIDRRIDEALSRGQHLRTIAETLAAWSGRPKRELYARVVARKK
ncbi:MAG: 16S rRNA (cytidine(1402)-2'-O)-methyltransferase [Myxococcales bacterium]|nr:16S rRNA (cytidine(1402)-2'-O)-methyltransferase [Myxococcales bacterium]